MSNARVICWMLLAVGLLVAAHLALDARGGGEPGIVRRVSLFSKADSAVSVSVARDGEQPTEMSKASGLWRITEPFSASADSSAVLRLLDALSFEPIRDSMNDSELRKLGLRRQDFRLDQPLVVVKASGPDGVSEVAFGRAAPAGDCVYASVDGSKTVYLVGTNVFAAANLAADDFRSRSLFSVDADEIGAFDVKGSAGSFMRFMREGGTWRMADGTGFVDVLAPRVDDFLSRLLGAKAAGFIWPVGASNETETASVALLAGYGLDPESAVTVTFKGKDGTDRQVSFGKVAEKGFVYALAHNGGAIVTVDADLKNLVTAGSGAFLDTRLFPYEEGGVSSVSISDGEVQFLLAKGADGYWRLDAPVAAPADSEAVASLVSRLLTLHTSDMDSSGVMISLSSNAPPVAVSRESVLGNHRLEDLRSREIIRIDPAHVRRIVVTPSDGKPDAVLYDSDRNSWNVETSQEAGVADLAVVESLLAALNPLTASRIVKIGAGSSDLGRYGLEKPAFVIAVDRRQEDSVRRNILIGDSADGGRYVTLGASDEVFLVGGDVAERLTARLVRKQN